MPSPPDGRRVITHLARIDLRAAIDEELRGAQCAGACSVMERSRIAMIGQVDRHAGIHEQLENVRPIAPRGLEHHLARLPVFRMLLDQRAHGITIEPHAGLCELFFIIENGRRDPGAEARKEIRHLGLSRQQRFLIERALWKTTVSRGRRIRIRAMLQQPLSESQVAFFHRGLEQEAGAGPVSARVKHHPLRIFPGSAARCVDGAFVDKLEPPQHVAAEMRVVKHLLVERLRAALQQQIE